MIEEEMDLLLIFGVSGVVFGGACAILASNKKRDAFGWFVLGFLFNLVALIVIAVLTPTEEAAAKEPRRRDFGSDGRHDQEELRKKASDLAASLAQSKAKLTN